MTELHSMIEGCLRGEEQWQHKLYEAFSPRMFGVCLRYAASRHEAEDLLVEGFMQVFRALPTYKGKGPFEAWMYRIFVNTAINAYHRAKRQAQRVVIDSSQMVEPTCDEDTASTIDMADALQQSLNALKAEDRLVFNLIALEGFSYQETAQRLKRPVTTIKSQYYRARDFLRCAMEKRLKSK
ncbi:MAG: RNA polymerase sigma factor [Bacteroidales bacterium]|nr:RNA polymerase sigma factor [Bacteroidales bacterium]